MRRAGWVAFLVLALGAGCDGEQVSDAGSDAGRLPDAGGDDAGGDDAGMDDGGPPPDDGGPPPDDGGPPPVDAGMDGGPPPVDAGPIDAGPGCGNGVVDGTDECDGTDFNGATCVTELGGGATGTLACNSCVIDNSGCQRCGNLAIEGSEECDGTAFGTATCDSEFGAGAIGSLACNTCMIDSSGCSICGDSMITGTETCDGTNLGTAACASQGFMSGVLGCSGTCAFDTSDCSAAAPVTAAMQLVITEVVQDPAVFADVDGEWFEVHNPGGTALNLRGCVVTGTGTTADTFTVTTNLVAPAGGYITFAPMSAMAGAPGFTPSYTWTGGFALANGADGITITCGGVAIDSIAWDNGVTFPDPTGASMTLDPRLLNATANDTGSNWCIAISPYGGGTTPDLGTPNAANDSCPSPIGFCRLQFPTTIMGMGGEVTDVFGRVFVAGITDVSGVNDPNPRFRAQVGFGPDGSDPATSTMWLWTNAAPNAGYGPGSQAYEANNDEYMGALTSPGVSGQYDFAYRFSGDSGATWTVCDSLAAGSSDGYDPANAGQMTIVAPPPTITGITGTIDVLAGGGTGILVVTLSAPAPAGYVVTITSSVDTSVSVPIMFTFPAGATSAGFRVRGLAMGSSVVTVTNALTSSMQMAVVNVVASASAPAMADLILNEILYDVPGGVITDVQGDANCSGNREQDQSDEYIELVNASGHPVDLTGVAVWDATNFDDAAMTGLPPRFTFPSFTLGAGEAVVVFGLPGGTSTMQPWCATATSAPFRVGDAAAFGVGVTAGLNLTNGAETIRVTATNVRTSTLIVSQAWTTSLAVDQGWTLSPDLTGPRTPHNSALAHATDRAFSPGTRLTGTPFAVVSAP